MKYLLFITALFTIFAACDKPDDPVETYYLDKELYDYVIFPKGSYWIYEEENSAQEDSVIVISYNKEIIIGNTDVEYNYEFLYIDYFSSQLGHIDGFATAKYQGIYGYNRYSERFNINASMPNKFKFLSNKAIGDTISFTQSRKMVKKDEVELMDVKGNTYSEVVVFNQLDAGYNMINVFYYAKGVGLIKEEDVENNKTWNLIDYHINN